jgi:Uma2 family endonuclease
VLLVVEVADETLIQDLNVKAKLYGQAGYPVYWVVTQEAIYEHTGRSRRATVRGSSTTTGSASPSRTPARTLPSTI